MADHDRRPGVPEHARARATAARGVPGACACPTRWSAPTEGHQPGGGGAAGRLGRAGPAGRARHPDPGRAAGVRAARHVRRAVRGDRPDGRPVPGGGQAAREPGPPPGQGGGRGPTPIWAASERWSTRSSPRRAAAISTPWWRCSTRTSCCGPTRAPAPRSLHGGQRRGRRSQPGPHRASTALRVARLRPALVNGAAGVIVTVARTALRRDGLHRRRRQDRRDRRDRRPRTDRQDHRRCPHRRLAAWRAPRWRAVIVGPGAISSSEMTRPGAIGARSRAPASGPPGSCAAGGASRPGHRSHPPSERLERSCVSPGVAGIHRRRETLSS